MKIAKNLIFVHERVGYAGMPFKMYKVRTMYPGADEDKSKYLDLNEADGPVFKIKNDPRYTKLGKVLADTGLDELPQLINVLRGEMAVVGPRPLPADEEKKIPLRWRQNRRTVKPGITSSWVVSGGHNLRFREWMELDMKDIRRKSFRYDAGIVLQTILAVVINVVNLAFAAILRQVPGAKPPADH